MLKAASQLIRASAQPPVRLLHLLRHNAVSLRCLSGSPYAASQQAAPPPPSLQPQTLQSPSEQPTQPPIHAGAASSRGPSRGPVSWTALALVLVAGGGVVLYFTTKRREKKAAAAARVETFGRPALGGPWSLVDGDGVPVTSGDFAGSYQLLYFGFTFCPDICPSELVKMSRAVDAVDSWTASPAGAAALAPTLHPLFITLDPRRDSCEQVRTYTRDFHPRMRGLTGTPGQIAKVAKAFRVYFQGVDTGADGDNEDYLGMCERFSAFHPKVQLQRSFIEYGMQEKHEWMLKKTNRFPPQLRLAVDHSIVMYLVGPDNEFLDFYVQSMTAQEVAARIQSRMIEAAKARK